MPQRIPSQTALISLSGGLDSTTVLAYADSRFGTRSVKTIAFDYGQKHRLELEQAQEISMYYGLELEIIKLPRIFSGAGSTLVDEDIEVESIGTYEELAARFGSQPTVVPNRNMNFIAMSVTYALTHGFGHVLLGVHAGDAANYHYPDCRPAFIGAMAAAIDIATEGEVELLAPFNHMTKGQIVKEARKLGAPLYLTQSCYNGKRPACGKCATCHERINAFNEAGLIDPIEYETPIEWPDRSVPWSADLSWLD